MIGQRAARMTPHKIAPRRFRARAANVCRENPEKADVMAAQISDQALDFLLARAGLDLTPAQKADLKSVFPALAEMAERVRKPRGQWRNPPMSMGLPRRIWVSGRSRRSPKRPADRGEEAVAGGTDARLPRPHPCPRQPAARFHSLTEDRALADAKAAEAAIMRDGPRRRCTASRSA